MSRRSTVVQVPLHRKALCRTPLCIVLLILGIHGVKVRDRGSRKRSIVVPAEEVIACPRCRLNRHVRIRNGIACDRVRIVCRVSCRATVIQVPVHRVVLRRTPLCIEVLIDRIADREARNRRAAECSVVVPALEVIAGPCCRSQGNVRVEHGIACHRVRIGRRMSRGYAVIQGICDRIVIGRTPLCIEGLGRRVHGRETCDRRTGEGSVVVPALKGIAVSKRRQEVNITAAVCEHRVACEVRCRIGRRVSRGRAVIQHVVNRVAVRRSTPLRVVVLILCVHGVQACDRCPRKARIVVPAFKGIAGPRCRMYGDIRVLNGVACDCVRIVCRVTHRGVIVQIPLHRIALCSAPLCIVVLIGRIVRREARNRRARKARVIVPALKVIAGPRRRCQRDVRIEHGIACDRVRVGRRVTRRRTVIQRVLHRIGKRCAPLRVEGLGRRIHGREGANRRARKARIVVPAKEGIARTQRICHRNRARQGLNRIARQINRQVGCRMARAVIQHIVDRVALRRTPLCIVVLIFRIHGVKRADRCARKARIIVPAFKGITCTRRSCDCEIRLGDIVAELRVRVGRRMTRRRRIIQMIADTVRIRATPSRVVVLILRIHGVQIRDRGSREGGIRIPTEEAVSCSRRRLNRHVRIEHGIRCHRVRVARRMTCGSTVIQLPLHRIVLGRTPLCIVVLILRIHGVQGGDRRSRERRIVIPALEVIAGPRCRAQCNIRIQYGIACDRVRIACRMARRRAVI